MMTEEDIKRLAGLSANDANKHRYIELDYRDGVYYGFIEGYNAAIIGLSTPPAHVNREFPPPLCENDRTFVWYTERLRKTDLEARNANAQLSRIKDVMNRAVIEGKTSISTNYMIREDTLECLRTEGFIVDYYPLSECWLISWNK